ncbi:hypothetical protein B0H65DRAFT_264276 [Neurospora tetraspora]|uniref:Uncharacterized protein n=1 Tax=Neurospora tetraspora TaxID=94610 RepID=A0AAE0MPW9_9PEZI|nr:hypothetical protein B0H65DRAFT_264276 [Neurospora tetraspora]
MAMPTGSGSQLGYGLLFVSKSLLPIVGCILMSLLRHLKRWSNCRRQIWPWVVACRTLGLLASAMFLWFGCVKQNRSSLWCRRVLASGTNSWPHSDDASQAVESRTIFFFSSKRGIETRIMDEVVSLTNRQLNTAVSFKLP